MIPEVLVRATRSRLWSPNGMTYFRRPLTAKISEPSRFLPLGEIHVTQFIVKKYLTTNSGPQNDGDAYTVSELLSALSTQHINNLTGFARLRIRSVTSSAWLQGCLAITEPEDLVAEALLKLKLGEENPSLGRHLQPHSRASMTSFLAAVKGIICSDLDHLVREARTRYQHLPVGDSDADLGEVEPAVTEDTYRLLSRRDLHRVLFAQLHQRIRSQPALLAVVQDWERRFLHDDRLGEGQNTNLIYRVRVLAREILAELAAEFAPAPCDGKEMLL